MNTINNPQSFYEQYVAQVERDKQELLNIKKWTTEHKTAIAVGVASLSLTGTIVTSPYESLKETVSNSSWVLGGAIIAEGLWLGGAAIMLAGVGKGVGFRDLRDLKNNFKERAKESIENRFFKSGFIINATGAVSQAAILSAGVIKEAPVSAYGLLTLPLVDLATTLATRKIIYDSMKKT